ncbi:MAG: prepilin peptidase [Alphaproteobacteria bacterium]|nr:prepilin peptidase [Alphaproteobacteria bacterium]
MTDLPPPFDAAWFRFAFGFIIGAALGSFATMLAYRLPRRLSILFPRSHCPTCNATLGALDLVPILSWLAMRGRCRHCCAEISVRYLGIELATSFACAIASVVIGLAPALGLAYVAIVAVVAVIGAVIPS